LENSTAIRVAMGNNAIRKNDAIKEARQLTAQTIEALEESVGQLTQELAETKDRLVAAQTIDLEVHTRENAQKERL
jgi:dihydroorotase-like cyclic amidohydrolase